MPTLSPPKKIRQRPYGLSTWIINLCASIKDCYLNACAYEGIGGWKIFLFSAGQVRTNDVIGINDVMIDAGSIVDVESRVSDAVQRRSRVDVKCFVRHVDFQLNVTLCSSYILMFTIRLFNTWKSIKINDSMSNLFLFFENSFTNHDIFIETLAHSFFLLLFLCRCSP